MSYQRHILTILNCLERRDYREIETELDVISLGIVCVESWFRPFGNRLLEYLGVVFGKCPTIGLCQAKYGSWWPKKTRLNFIKSIFFEYENIKTNFYVSKKVLLSKFGEEGGNVGEIVEFYTGSNNSYYSYLLKVAIFEIRRRVLENRV